MDKPETILVGQYYFFIPGYGWINKKYRTGSRTCSSEMKEHLNNIKEKKLLKLVALI